MDTKKIAKLSMLLSISVVLALIESFIPIFSGIAPGIKLGLANIVIAFVFFEFSLSEALSVSICRVLIMGILFGSPVSFLYSFCGAVFSFAGLITARLMGKRISYIGSSVLCAVLHNFGQSIVAAFFFGIDVAAFYLPYLLFFGCVFGAITGTLLNYISKKYQKVISR